MNWEDADTERIQAIHGSMVVFMSWAWQHVKFEGKNKAYLRATVSDMKILNHNEFNQERLMNEAVENAKDNDKKNMALFGRLGSFKKIAIGGTIHAYFQSRQKRKEIERNVNKEQPELPDNLIDARGFELQKPASELTLLLVEGGSARPIGEAIRNWKGTEYFGVFPITGKPPNPYNNENKKQGNNNKQQKSKQTLLEDAMGVARV